MKTLNDFIRENLHCSYDEANTFISNFRHYDAVDYGRNIVENHLDSFSDEFDVDSIDEETLACIAIRLEDDCLVDLSIIEDNILKDVFGDKYE